MRVNSCLGVQDKSHGLWQEQGTRETLVCKIGSKPSACIDAKMGALHKERRQAVDAAVQRRLQELAQNISEASAVRARNCMLLAKADMPSMPSVQTRQLFVCVVKCTHYSYGLTFTGHTTTLI